jgi:hypothetical protein
MRQKDDPKIKALEWYLQFLSNDVDQMNELDLEKLVVEARFYFVNPAKGVLAFSSARHLPSTIASLRERGKDTKDLEAGAKVPDIDKVNYYVPIFWQGRFPAAYPWRDNLKLVQAELRSFLEGMMKKAGNFIPVAKGDILFARIDGRFKVIYDIQEPAFEEIEDVSKLVEMAKLSFMFALNNIPDEGSIKKCRDCGKWFLHLSKKPKYYCNFRCTSRAASRKRREQDPEKYREEQREIMRRRYRERKAKERGVPVN